MRIYAMTKKGEHRENEDRILINDNIFSEGYFETEITEKITICVADGVGGNKAGALASSFVCDSLKNIDYINKNSLIDINDQLIEKSLSDLNYKEMATTLSGIYIADTSANIFHIGNTRIYVFQGSYIKQITEDHTSVNWLMKTGKISKKEAENYDKRNEITACFGGGNRNLINSLVFWENNEALLNAKKIVITSDGIHEYVSIDELEDILNNESLEPLDMLNEILELAKTKGSTDDKSIVIISK